MPAPAAEADEGQSPTEEPPQPVSEAPDPHAQTQRPPQPSAAAIAQWLLCPALFVAGCWAAAAAPQRFAAALPAPHHGWALGGPARGAAKVYTVLDTLPSSMHAAWQLGRLAGRLEGFGASGSSGGGGGGGGGNASSVLAVAAAVLGVPAARLSADQLLQLGAQLQVGWQP